MKTQIIKSGFFRKEAVTLYSLIFLSDNPFENRKGVFGKEGLLRWREWIISGKLEGE